MNPTLKRAIKPGIMYVSTGRTKCGTILAGDRLFLDDEGRLTNSTAFGWLNACTEYYDHHVRAHNDENRIASALWGVGDDMKQRALEIALAA